MRITARTIFLAFVLLSWPVQILAANDKWLLFQDTDPFTDEHTYLARLGRSLYVKCERKGSFKLWFDFKESYERTFHFEKLVEVRYRFGKGEVHEEIWKGGFYRVYLRPEKPDFAWWLTSGQDFTIEFKESGGKPFRETYVNSQSPRLLHVISGCPTEYNQK